MENEFGFWDVLNVLFRLGIIAIVVTKLWRFYDSFSREERLGLGIAGGCVLMTIPVIVQGPDSPFSEWAGAFFALGVLVYFAGRLKRTRAHDRANRRQVRIAQQRRGEP